MRGRPDQSSAQCRDAKDACVPNNAIWGGLLFHCHDDETASDTALLIFIKLLAEDADLTQQGLAHRKKFVHNSVSSLNALTNSEQPLGANGAEPKGTTQTAQDTV